MPPAVTSGSAIAADPAFDATAALLREGYAFGSRRCEALHCDAFQTRLMLRRVVFARGADAAAMFYHPGRFTRRGAIPPTVVAMLQDFGSVQQMDGERHAHRKRLFLQLLDPDGSAAMARLLQRHWRARARRWERQARTVLIEEARVVLGQVACEWAGITLDETQAERVSRDLGTIVDAAGSFGPRLARGLWARHRLERWARGVIRGLRAQARNGCPASAIAHHRERDGVPLPTKIAAIELLNLLRPTVAVAQWIAFAALALRDHPELAARLRAGEPQLLRHFTQEVRRFYPFFPMIGGYVREPFEWRGRRFKPGDWVMLDLHGTHHHPALWARPERFDPDRFRGWSGDAYTLVPQGAGDPATDHRFPGENASITLLMAAIDELANGLRYELPPQDLDYRLNRFPSMPESGLVMTAVRLRPREAGVPEAMSSCPRHGGPNCDGE